MLKPLFALLLGLNLCTAHAAVIFSECPVKPTEVTSDSAGVDRFRPSDFRLKLRSYSRELAGSLRYFSWFYGWRMSDDDKRMQLRDLGSMTEDVEMTMILSDQKTACHGEKENLTDPYAIFPFVLRLKDAGGKPIYHVRYKYCEYYIDQNRQLPIENECRVIGRESGYTFQELTGRYRLLENHLGRARDGVKAVTMLGAVVGSVGVLKVARVLRLGFLSGVSLATVPSAAGYLAISTGLTDEFVRDMANFQDAAEVAVTGDLETAVKVAHPIQDFLPYFERYLSTIDAQKEMVVSTGAAK